MFRKLKLLSVLLSVSLLFTPFVFAASVTDEGVLGNDRWSIQNDGDLVPNTASSYDIGSASYPVDNAYIDNLTVGGAKIFTGSAANGNAVYAEVGAYDATGSIYLTTAGALYVQVANAGAATDWFKVTATDAD